MIHHSHSAAKHDTLTLQTRALRRRQRYVHAAQRTTICSQVITRFACQLVTNRRALPLRYTLHLLVGLLIPLAIAASQLPVAVATIAPTRNVPFADDSFDLIAPVAPLP